MEIVCNQNRAYEWVKEDKCFFKGYIFEPELETFLESEDAIKYIERCESFEEFTRMLKRIRGMFAIVYRYKDEVWGAVDHVASFPLYYYYEGDVISDEVDEIIRLRGLDKNNYNSKRILELFETSYVAFDNTVYDEIKSIQCGQAIRISREGLFKEFYYTHMRDSVMRSKQDTVIELDRIANEVVKETLAWVGDRRIVLSLSGGYDSRFLACLLKKNGAQNVLCYCYGAKGSREMVVSQKVAKALGYEWCFVEYDYKKSGNEILQLYNQYYQFETNHDHLPHTQTLWAIEELRRKGILYDSDVFMTGLTNDCQSGNYIVSREIGQKYKFDNEGVAKYIVNRRFKRIPIVEEVSKLLIDENKDYLQKQKINVCNYQTFAEAANCLEFVNVNDKHYLKMAKVYEYYNYKWLAPLLNKQLIDYWYSVEPDLKRGQAIFEEYLMNNLLNAYNLAERKKAPSITKKHRKVVYTIARMMAKLCWPCGIPLKRKTDVTNWSSFEVLLYKRIANKKMIFEKAEAIRLLEGIYYLESIYGKNWYGRIEKYLE